MSRPAGRLAQPKLQLGDVVAFPETLIHGAMPVSSPRLSIYFMFMSGHVCYKLGTFSDRTRKVAAEMGFGNMLEPAYVSKREKCEDTEIRRQKTPVA